MVFAIWIIEGSARSADGGLGVIDQRAIDAAGRHGYRRLHWSELEGGCCLLSTGCRPPSVEWVVTVWISPAVDNGRLRSVDRSLAGVGSDGGLLGKMEYRNSVLRWCTYNYTHA
ncbi:hypothetical protein ACLOJK_026877, partial [Asimina triloba]